MKFGLAERELASVRRAVSRRRPNLRLVTAASAAAAAFSGNFIDLFPGAYQLVQTDLGVTYGGTFSAQGTTPPVITLTGSLNAGLVPTSIVITDTLIGILGTWQGLVTYGDGTTQAFTSAATVPLTGRGLGLTLNIAAGAAAGNNTWTATWAGLADQSGNGKNFAQATNSKQPTLGVGLNGNPSVACDGATSSFVSTLTLPAPGTTTYYICAVFRQRTWVANKTIFGRTSAGSTIYQLTSTPNISSGNGSDVTNGGAALNAWVDLEVKRSNNSADTYKLGATTVTGNSGNTAAVGCEIGSAAGTGFGNCELLLLVHTPNLPNWVSVRAAIAAKYGAGNVLI